MEKFRHFFIYKERYPVNILINNNSIYKIFTLITLILLFSAKINFAQPVPAQTYSGMKWRIVGPFRAGWATMAEGIPDEPNTFYFGGAGGGVWKTNDAGRTWHPLMQQEKSSSVGALAIAPSNPKIIYVGTGQVALRYDMLSGDGVYKTEDGGKTWKNIGLNDTRHIGRILIDNKNPERILVAAMGHAFRPNNERGVYLTKDGGKNWQHVLFVNDSTGAVDLAADPLNPSIVYAALWKMQMHPWLDYFMPQTGLSSGIFKSEDGGEHWVKLSGGGLPDGPLGRIGLAVAQGSNGKIVYATIDASNGGSGFYKSNDAGKSWQYINKNGSLANSYFSRITIDPKNPEIVYVMDRSIHRSEDGGKNFTIFKGAPGGDDYHFLWINPSDPTHMITASDQGCVVTVNGGKSWSSWYNQPTGQFYHLAVDDQFPYKIYSGQQDNGTVGILSRGPYGVIEDRDWHPVGGDERDYDIPKPGDPNIVFGSGLGGPISRFNETTRQVAAVSPWPISSYGARQTKVRYRYTWITPIAFSPLKPYPLYFGAQYLFKSLDDGDHWQIISPDLSGKVKGAKDYQDPDPIQAKDAGYGVIFSIAPSPVKAEIIWVGTDDGLIQLTTDNGKQWHNVTPPLVPVWARIDAISPSPFNPAAAYIAVNTHRIGKHEPLILKTSDYGKTWQTIIHGLPSDEYVNVVRTDNVRKGLLFAGTNRSVYVSFDNGDNWQPLTLNFPTTSVRDLVVHDNDLVAGTQGRGIWILDDIEPLREINTGIDPEPVHLFNTANAWRLRADENKDTPWPPSTPLGQNPPTGAIIDYWLKDNAADPIEIIIKDSKGNIVRQFSSEEKPVPLPAHRYFEKNWLGNPETISGKAGMHRIIWNLRYPHPAALQYHYSIAAVWDKDTPLNPEGALVLPGSYSVTLKVNGKEYTHRFTVKMDPRVHVSTEALNKQFNLARKVDGLLEQAVSMHKEIEEKIKSMKDNSPLKDSLMSVADNGQPSLASVSGSFADLVTSVQSADAAPTQGQTDVYEHYKKIMNELEARCKNFLKDNMQVH